MKNVTHLKKKEMKKKKRIKSSFGPPFFGHLFQAIGQSGNQGAMVENSVDAGNVSNSRSGSSKCTATLLLTSFVLEEKKDVETTANPFRRGYSTHQKCSISQNLSL